MSNQDHGRVTIGTGPILVLALDDYPSISHKYLESLPSDVLSKITIHILTKHLGVPPNDPTTLIPHLEGYEVLVIMRERTPLSGITIDSLPKLKYVITTGMRNNGLDVAKCKERGIIVCGTQGPPSQGNVSNTTQHTWSLILSLAANIVRDNNETVHQNKWLSSQPFNISLGGKTLGLLGLGKLGGETAKIGYQSFGMKIIAWSENLTQEKADDLSEKQGLGKGVYKAVNKEELLKQSDVLSIHVVLGERTRGLLKADDLGKMKKTALLINTARGPIIDEQALLKCLKKGGIRGAGIDVFDIEPLPLDSPWRTTKWGEEGRSQVILTPHSGYSYEETLDVWWQEITENVKRYAEGQELQNRIV